jgi:hypothetical protein
MFLVPPVACVVLFVIMWWTNVLPSPRGVGVCVLIGVPTQLLAQTLSSVWLAGLLLNVATAVYLTIRLKLSW